MQSEQSRCVLRDSTFCSTFVSHINHAYHTAQLPDSFKDFTGGKGMTSECATHCHREFFHAQWRILLDDEFLKAYEHGIVICCCDGIKHRFYPRIFTYSADYPEKYVKPNGYCTLLRLFFQGAYSDSQKPRRMPLSSMFDTKASDSEYGYASRSSTA